MAATPVASVTPLQEDSEVTENSMQGTGTTEHNLLTPDEKAQSQPGNSGALPSSDGVLHSPESLPSSSPADLRAFALQALADPKQRGWFFGVIACLLLLCKIFEVNIRNFVYHWSTDENYSHGFLVPLISLYFANLAFKRGSITTKGGLGLGLSLLVASILGRLVMILLPIPFMGDLSFLLGIAGICSLIGGSQALRRYGFAIFFLIFMIPLPIALYTMLASPLQLLASQIATVVLNATGVPVLCEGNMMSLPGGIQMFVAEACSGMRQLTGFLALSAAVAYLSDRPGWYRAAVVVSAIPIAITANVTRVTLTGYIMYFVDRHYASGTYHTLEGLLMMGFGLGLLSLGRTALDQVVILTSPPPPPAVA